MTKIKPDHLARVMRQSVFANQRHFRSRKTSRASDGSTAWSVGFVSLGPMPK